MKGKLSTKTIIIAIIAIVLFAAAVTGTVLFLKDSGEAAAAEEQNVLPVAGNDNEAGSNTEQTVENEGASSETSTEVEQTETESGEVTATTPSQTTGVLAEEPEATTVEQERVVSEETTLGWNNLLVSAEEADYAGIEINYNNLKYTVEYYFDGEIDEELTEVVDKNQKGKVIDTYTDKNKVGYKLDITKGENGVEGLPLEISENQTNNAIKVYYVKDQNQVNELTYTVNHVIVNGNTETEVATETFKENIYVLDEQKITIQENTVEALAEDDERIVGYMLDERRLPEEETGYKVESGRVITFYYVKDESQVNELTYTVKHVTVNGKTETEVATNTYEENVYVLDEQKITIQANTVKALAEDDERIVGYMLDETRLPEEETGYKVESGTVITFYYVKDESQVNELTYTVKHVTVNGKTETEVATNTYEENVYVLDEQKITIQANTVKALAEDDERIVGYMLDERRLPEEETGYKVESGRVITFYYVKDESQVNELTYTVKHVTVNGKTETEVATNTYEENVYVLDEQKITIQANTVKALAEDDERIVGYMLDETRLPEEETGYKVESGRVITFYYVKDESQVNELTYTVKHVTVNGKTETEVATNTYEENVYVLDEQKITIQANTVKALAEDDERIVGYMLDERRLPEEETGYKVESGRVITFYYVKDESQVNELTYTVKHVTVNGKTETEVATNTYEENVYVLDEQKITIQANTVKALAEDDERIVGYMLDETRLPEEETGYKVESGTVITFYYEIIKYPFTVKYYYNNVEDRSAIVEGSAPEGTIITIADKSKDGFKKYAEPADTEIKASQTANVFKVYYGKPEIKIEKSAPEQVNYGENIHYTIKVTNSGFLGTTVTVTDTLEGTTYKDGSSTEPVSVNGNVLTWKIQIEAAKAKGNAVETIEFDAIVPTQTLLGTTFENTVTSKTKENEESSSDEISTKIKEFDVIYDEYKEGKSGEDLNIIFIIDNSSSMNDPIAGQSYTNNNANAVAPTDRTKTRIESAKSAIQSFITSQSDNTMTVIKYNGNYSNTNKSIVELIGEGYNTTKKIDEGWIYDETYYEATIGEKTVELWYEDANLGYIGELDGKKYVLGTDGKCYEYEEKTSVQGTQVIGTTMTGKTGATNNEGLKTAISNMTIGDLRSSFGTYVSPAFNKAKDYIISDKTNVVIVLSDGAFNDYDYEYYESDKYKNMAKTLIDSGVDYIYSVAFGSDADEDKLALVTNIYEKDANGNDTTNKKVYPASDSATLLAQFKAIEEAASGAVQNLSTANGTVTFAPASNDIQVKTNCPITAYITGTTTKLFESTDVTELKNKYGIEIGEDGKTLTWNANTFIANNPDKIQTIIDGNSKITIKYYIPNSN